MTEQAEKLSGASLDIPGEKRSRLKQLFPSVFTEMKNDQGEFVESIDFEKLKAELGTFSDLFENRRERYGMDWPGKKEALRLIQTPSHATLKPCREESINFDTTENLYIEGDNLEVLKLLQKSYYGKVKMIYIDPPYNTGNDFIYPDNYSETLQTYLEYTGQVDAEGRKFSTNTDADGRFHSKWLNMMYPRLYLARNLLSEDGFIFVSIDDHELPALRFLMEYIFGEENFLIQLIWHRRQMADSRNQDRASTDHEYVVVFKKGNGKLLGKDVDIGKYLNPDNDPRGPWFSADLTGLANKEERPNLHYDLINQQTGTCYPPSPTRGWSCSKDTMARYIFEDRILWPSKSEGRPRLKKFLSEVDNFKTGFSSMLEVGHTTDGTRTIQELFGDKIFPFSKPVSLLSTLVNQATTNKDSEIILDFFAGSSTTAHAILDLNNQDGGKRKFILVQLPEPTGREDYTTIADIGKERIRKVIKKLNDEQEGKLDLENTKEQDRGFRVLKLDQSNFKQWKELPLDSTAEKILEQIELHIDHISHTATQEDLLFEILLKAGFMPTEKAETMELAGKTVFSLAEGELFICLEDTVTKELIDAVAAAEPQQFICLDAAFGGNDQLKANTVQTFAALNMQKEKHNQILFRTV